MNEGNKFDPMYNIPSMEELDRQWKEMQAAENARNGKGGNGSTSRSGAGNHSSGRRSTAGQRGNGGRTAAGQRSGVNRAGSGQRSGNSQRNNVRRQDAAKREMEAAAGKKGSKKAQELNKSGKKKKPKRFKKFRMFLKILFLLLLVALLGVLMFLYFKYGDDLLKWKNEARELVEESNKNTFRSSEASTIYAANKKPIAKLKGDRDSTYVEFQDIPQAAIDCMVATEDREFYEHKGVNFLSTAKAAALYIKGKMSGSDDITRGGSTITQQVAKNVFLTNAQTEERKMREIFIAMELEQKYEKDEIMEFYLNVICFANNHFGIQAASKAYFSKDVKELDLAEIAFLCAIPNRPTTYDPLQHFDNTNERKVRILDQLLEAGKITAAEYSDAKYEKIVLNPAEPLKTQDYMTTYAISCATKALMKHRGFEFQSDFSSAKEEKKYDEEYKKIYDECHSLLYTGGYQIYTSLSTSKQNKLQKAVNSSLSGFKKKTKDGTYKLQGAATCIDNKTGFVVAIVGGRKQKDTIGYTLNRAFQSYRQPGSSFKPLVVYTPQLERNYTPNTIVDDTPFEDGPKNSNGRYAGKIPLRTAVEQSKNVVAWKLFEELTPKVGLSYVVKMNFSQIVDSDYYPAASLGGLTNGVSTVEMASGYATIENDGVYREPTCVKKITDANGNVLLNNNSGQEQKQIYEETAARTMTDILTGVLIRGTARGKGLSNNMACAGKTGTTSDKKDGWFCGYTPYYTTAVWVGYDSPQTLDDLYGSTYPLTIWHEYMEQIHEKLEPTEFADYQYKPKSSKKDKDKEDSLQTEEPTMEPDAQDEPDVEVTKKPKATKKPKTTKTPEPQDVEEPTKEPEEDIEDIPDPEEEPDDVVPEE